MIQLKKLNWWILLFAVPVLLRVWLAPITFHADVLSFAGWGDWIYQNGFLGFYENTTWADSLPTQPPLISLWYGFCSWFYHWLVTMFSNLGVFIAVRRLAPTKFIWFFNFSQWFGNALYMETYYRYGLLLVIKYWAILADLVMGFLFYKVATTHNVKRAWLFPLSFLAVPFSWYLSALWGQYDGVAVTIFLLGVICLLNRKISWLGLPIITISVLTKPTGLVALPTLGLFYLLKNESKLYLKVFSIVLSLLIFFVTTWPFAGSDLVHFVSNVLYPKLFLKSEYRIATLSFNFWHIFLGTTPKDQDEILFLIATKYWSYLIFILLQIVAILVAWSKKMGSLYAALFIVMMGSWLFLMNMAERYEYSAIVLGLILCILNFKIFKYWLALALIFSLNLYFSWLYPESLGWLHEILLYSNELIPRILSLVNTLTFIRILLILKTDYLDYNK